MITKEKASAILRQISKVTGVKVSTMRGPSKIREHVRVRRFAGEVMHSLEENYSAAARASGLHRHAIRHWGFDWPEEWRAAVIKFLNDDHRSHSEQN